MPHDQVVDCVLADTPQSEKQADLGEQPELLIEKLGTVGKLLRQWLVLGRCTANGRRDVNILEFEPIVPRPGKLTIGKPKAIGRAIEPLPALVPGEHSVRTIGSMGRKRVAIRF